MINVSIFLDQFSVFFPHVTLSYQFIVCISAILQQLVSVSSFPSFMACGMKLTWHALPPSPSPFPSHPFYEKTDVTIELNTYLGIIIIIKSYQQHLTINRNRGTYLHARNSSLFAHE